MRRSAYSLVPVLLLVLALAGCSGAPTTATTGPTVEPSTTTPSTAATTTTPSTTTGGANDTGSAMFRDNPEHTGVYASGGPTQLNGLVWKFKTGAAVFSSPAISNGVAYFGSQDSLLYALDTKTGQEKWKFKAGAEVASSPAVSDGVVYFDSDDGYLYAVR